MALLSNTLKPARAIASYLSVFSIVLMRSWADIFARVVKTVPVSVIREYAIWKIKEKSVHLDLSVSGPSAGIPSLLSSLAFGVPLMRRNQGEILVINQGELPLGQRYTAHRRQTGVHGCLYSNRWRRVSDYNHGVKRLAILSLLFSIGLMGQLLNPVPQVPLEVTKMQNILGGQIIDNRSQFQAQNNYIGFCGKGTGFWSVALQFADASPNGPWTTPGGSATVSNYNTTCIGSFLGYHNWFRFQVTGSATVSYSAVKDFWMPQGGGQVTTYPYVLPYVTNATTSPQVIPASIHGQGPNVTVDCWSGLLTMDFHLTGNKVLCFSSNDGQGNITVQWFSTTVKSIMISAAGPGQQGPAGLGAAPYVVNSATSPQLITQADHGQGFNVTVDCWSGALVGGHITGTKYPCQAVMDPTGNGSVTVSWTGTAVGCIMVSASGRPGPYVTNTTSSPQVIPVATHNQGMSPNASCWSGPVSAGNTTGHQILCDIQKDTAGTVTISWGGSTVGSIQIQ